MPVTPPSPVGASPPPADLLDPDFYRDDPHPAFTWMRAHDPVHRDEVNGLWAVSRHADVMDVERRSAVFSSQSGYRSWWAPEENNIISLDDPAHVRQRRIVSPRFTPRAVRSHSEWLGATIDELLDAIAVGGRGRRRGRRRRVARGAVALSSHRPAHRVRRRSLAAGEGLVGTSDAHRPGTPRRPGPEPISTPPSSSSPDRS